MNNMKAYCYVLESPPGARYHFGEVTRDSSLSSSSIHPHSDTLFGAIIHNAFNKNKEKAQQLLNSFENDEIIISSAFFYIENEDKRIHFLPKPIEFDFAIYDTASVDPKKVRQVKMLSWELVKAGLGPDKWFDENYCLALQDGEFICLKSEGKGFETAELYSKQITPKNPILYTSDKKDEEKDDERKIYYQTDVFLSYQSEIKVGYYFLLKHSESLSEQLLHFLDECVQLIVDFGLGGDRSTGGGAINKIEKMPFEWDEENNNAFVNLSLFLPKDENYRKGNYKVIKRGGLGTKTEHRLKLIQCIAEGGVFPEKLNGQIVEIGKEKLKNGQPYWLPLNLKNFDL